MATQEQNSGVMDDLDRDRAVVTILDPGPLRCPAIIYEDDAGSRIGQCALRVDHIGGHIPNNGEWRCFEQKAEHQGKRREIAITLLQGSLYPSNTPAAHRKPLEELADAALFLADQILAKTRVE